MAKLNQIIAIEKDAKSRVYSAVTDLHKIAQKHELFNGLARSYQPKDDDGEMLPPENKRVQATVDDLMRSVARHSTELFDITARKDWSNTKAAGDVVIDGQTILADVPVTYLLFLEKQLTDIRTIVGVLPVLDPAETWERDPNAGLYKTAEIKTMRSRKAQMPIVLYDATPEHPAQTQLITQDVQAGHWSQYKHSGAMPRPEKDRMTERVQILLTAVKQAREAANAIDEVAPPTSVGDAVFTYLLGENR